LEWFKNKDIWAQQCVEIMNKAYLLTGGNVGNTKQYLSQASNLLSTLCGNIIKQSAIYQTDAWGKTNQPAFLNQVLLLQTPLAANELMNNILLIEEKMGRKRLEKFGPRIIDIDILLFNDEVHDTAYITIPHPELPNRRFALTPLAAIAATYHHPVLNKTIKQLLLACTDNLNVKKIA
jgi:2-amino-4-hydroxy-6-hydroxymethyldihydropteridine diphosphokinase